MQDSKRDRSAPRTIEDLIQKYRFGKMDKELKQQIAKLFEYFSTKLGDWKLGVCEYFKNEYNGISLYYEKDNELFVIAPHRVFYLKRGEQEYANSATWIEIIESARSFADSQ